MSLPNSFSIVPTGGTGNKLKIGALILAAGCSSRMGEFKPLLKIDGKSLLERAIALFRDTGAEEIVTVVGNRAEELIPIIRRTSSRYVANKNYQKGMFSSIRKGVAELKGRCDAFFLLPVDIPCVQAATIRQLLAAHNSNSSLPVCYPVFQNRRGHPPLIAARLIDHVISYTGKGGMRGFLRTYENHALNLPVDDPFVRLDVDTKHDFVRLKNEVRENATK